MAADKTRVCAVDELPSGQKRRVFVGGRPIALCRTASGELYAVSDNCPHQGASLCAGTLGGMNMPSAPGVYEWGREGEILRCPWHGWEFDVTSGRSAWGEDHFRLATYPVTVEDGYVVVRRRAKSSKRR